jgi:hypothetical protein
MILSVENIFAKSGGLKDLAALVVTNGKLG